MRRHSSSQFCSAVTACYMAAVTICPKNGRKRYAIWPIQLMVVTGIATVVVGGWVDGGTDGKQRWCWCCCCRFLLLKLAIVELVELMELVPVLVLLVPVVVLLVLVLVVLLVVSSDGVFENRYGM